MIHDGPPCEVERTGPEPGEASWPLPDGLSEWMSVILPLLGDAASVLHAPDIDDGRLSGTDVDCAVERGAWFWPLRLPADWALCQTVRYDLGGSVYVLEHDGETVMFDVLDDPLGLGRDGLATRALGSAGSPTATRAAYLTSKRIRKHMLAPVEWQRIARLARDDEAAYRERLRAVMGAGAARLLGAGAVAGRPPGPTTYRAARVAQQLHRVRSPWRVVLMTVMASRRWATRVRHPTGLSVLIVGPDGSGKSTLAAALPHATWTMFRRSAHVHWRPGLLPRPGALVGRSAPDASEPHGRPPHGRVRSAILLTYYWADIVLGEALALRLTRVGTGLVVTERGWWDIVVDPRRYRLAAPERLHRALSHLVPRPDLTLVLRGDPTVLVARKPELGVEEVARQLDRWPAVLPPTLDRVECDATLAPDELARAAADAIAATMESRSTARLHGGWASLPTRDDTRWTIPRMPRRVAAASLAIYHPMTSRGRVGWEVARAVAQAGGFQLLRRGLAPPRAVRTALAPHVGRDCTYAVARANHPGRFVALIIDRDGRCLHFAKLATAPDGHAALAHEARALCEFAPALPPPLAAPVLRQHEPGLLLLDAIPWRPRRRPWLLSQDVAHALGKFFASGGDGGRAGFGLGHGDFAPWNLLATGEGWVLIDWEQAGRGAPVFRDLAHHLTQAHVLLGHPTAAEIVAGLLGRPGWVSDVIDAYADGAGAARSSAPEQFGAYLESSEAVCVDTVGGGAALETRRRLRRALREVTGT
jgi:hypothetical protein